MTTVHIDIDQLPKVLSKFYDQVPFAASRALNTVGFKVRAQAISTEFAGDLEIRDKTQAKRTTLVNKATKRDLQVEVGSTAWYMKNLSGGAKRTPIKGVEYEGKKYLVMPSDDRTRTTRGKLKKLPKGNSKPFIIRTRAKGQLLYVKRKRKKKARPLILIGILVEESLYKRDTFSWRKMTRGVPTIWEKEFKREMVRAARTAK